jgi:hypothetical protein
VGSSKSAPSPASLYVRAGEKIERGLAKVRAWELRRTKFHLHRLERRNRASRKPVTGESGIAVSLTTYGPRIQTVHLTIESIAAGSELPSRLILWLDEEKVLRDLPLPLRRLQDRGLEILPTPNYGPYKKFYPYLESLDRFCEPLVTADDDVLYPASWLRGFRKSYAAFPSCVSCYRAHEIKFSGAALAPYVTWGRCRSSLGSFRHFATGVSGILYPPALLATLKAAGNEFQRVCPRTDDIWLHLHAIRAGYKIRQIRPWQRNYVELPNTQQFGLAVSNVHAAQNDQLLQALYTREDLNRIQADAIA